MKNLLFAFPILVFAFLYAPNTFAQKGTSVKGRVVAVNGEPVAYAGVVISTLGGDMLAGGVTGDDGRFGFVVKSAGKLRLKVSFMGYEDLEKDIELTAGKGNDLGDVSIKPSTRLLEEISVSADKAIASHKVDKSVYEASGFKASANGSAVDILRNLPSVTMVGDDVAVRGTTGFTVLVNGKPSQLKPAEVLGQLAGNLVERVEVITAPSAKYDPDGKAGLINIITKKGAADGLFVSANGAFGGTDPARYGGGLNLGYTKGKTRVYLGGDFRQKDLDGDRYGDIMTKHEGVQHDLISDGTRNYYEYLYSVQGGIDYDFSANDAISATFYTGGRKKEREADLLYTTERDDQPGTVDEFYNMNWMVREGRYTTLGLDYTHKFTEKSKLAFSGLYESSELLGPIDNRNLTEQGGDLELYERMDSENPLDGYRFSVDYETGIGQFGKFETGYRYRRLRHKGDFVYETLDLSASDNDTWIRDKEKSNSIDLLREIHSLYGAFSSKVGRISYNAGLRAEYTDREMESTTKSTPYEYSKFNLFPSGMVAYDLGNGQNVRLAYSKRVERPTTKLMNPFKLHRHGEVVEEGDPELVPEFIDLVELGYVNEFGANTFAFTTYYRHTEDKIYRSNAVYEPNILYRAYTNAGRAQAVGAEASVSASPWSWWNFFAGVNVYDYRVWGDIFGVKLDQSSLNWSVNANSTVSFTKTLKLNWNLSYRSETVTAQGEDGDFLMSDLALSQSLPKHGLTFSLQVRDIFESNIETFNTAGDTFDAYNKYTKEGQIFMLGVSYSLNMKNRKGKKIESEFGKKEF
ncbi:TonB-dependent receptor [Fulvitalea axinellae]|uniref:TonB-dependent receptor n=1 Tax=Fulvitalea axinellae TaxID=1182444 RepID=A0AAU9CM81_9BACT|nr:TonB-dependent receptor [Fulvitalea axinellae]